MTRAGMRAGMPQDRARLPGNWVAQLAAFARPAPSVERCELCGKAVGERHDHLVEPAALRLLCVCTGCALLFEHPAGTRYRRVPRRAALLEAVTIADADWRALGVPIDVAFFFQSSVQGGPVGLYPGAAGPVEAGIDASAWARLEGACPALAALTPDVEALLVNRMNGASECYRVPIDRCYALAGLIRRQWRGFSGGVEVWRVIGGYFDGLRRESLREGA